MSGYIFKLARKIAGEEPLFPEKGGKGGGDNGAGAQADAMRHSADLQDAQFNRIMTNLAPFTPLAQQYITQMQGLSTLEGQDKALQGFYGSDMYKRQADHMPFINIRITKEGATAEQKQKLIEGATQLLVDVLGKNPASTFVIIDEVETDNWGVGGQSVTKLRADAKK